MTQNDPLDSDADPFHPPAISTVVSCLHCGEEYDSYKIEWRVEQTKDGEQRGFWCCPVEGCDGIGFGFDIFSVDLDFHDERGGWVYDDDESEEEFEDEFEVASEEYEDADPRSRRAPRNPSALSDDDDEIPF